MTNATTIPLTGSGTVQVSGSPTTTGIDSLVVLPDNTILYIGKQTNMLCSNAALSHNLGDGLTSYPRVSRRGRPTRSPEWNLQSAMVV